MSKRRLHGRGPKRNRDRGMATLELVVIFPLVFSFMLLAVQAALYHFATQVALAAAEEGTRVASLDPTPGAGAAGASRYLTNFGGGLVALYPGYPKEVANSDLNTNQTRYRVMIKGKAPSLLPNYVFIVTERAEMASEIFTHG